MSETASPEAKTLAICIGMELAEAQKRGMSEDDMNMAIGIMCAQMIRRHRSRLVRVSIAGLWAETIIHCLDLPCSDGSKVVE